MVNSIWLLKSKKFDGTVRIMVKVSRVKARIDLLEASESSYGSKNIMYNIMKLSFNKHLFTIISQLSKRCQQIYKLHCVINQLSLRYHGGQRYHQLSRRVFSDDPLSLELDRTWITPLRLSTTMIQLNFATLLTLTFLCVSMRSILANHSYRKLKVNRPLI